MAADFIGFPADLFSFLRALSKNNNREWFNANKDRYIESVAEPVQAFINAMGPRLEKISPHYVADSRRSGGSMFRIYRDTRFSRNKAPYKENVGCQFRHEAGKDAHAAGFYVHLANDQIFFGGGVWAPPNDVLTKIRDAIVDNPSNWKKITRSKSFLATFDGVRGDGLKRPPRGYDPEHSLLEDLKRKTYYVMKPGTKDMAQSPGFIDEVTQTFKAASPFMKFVASALELPY
ncbi:MAG: DUF2461 domain-containing protein [Proteobacteria bacterium]|nr:DUF2461 domain-containing protein [Pseudomonadota bacterium]